MSPSTRRETRPTAPSLDTTEPANDDLVLSPDLAPRPKAMWVHAQLCAAYDAPVPFFSSREPVGALISALLSHRTRNRDSGAALHALEARYEDWAALRDAPTDEVEATIAGVTWPEQKAPRIQAALREITERHGELSLDFLADLEVDEARAWLEAIPGVGPKTSAAVLLFSRLRVPALPVDSHHHRVAQRLGLIGPKVGPGPAHAALAALMPPDWDAQTVYDHHEVFMFHGQKVCHWRNPRCDRCVVRRVCRHYATLVGVDDEHGDTDSHDER